MAEVSQQLWVVANFRETDLHGICPGQPAMVKVDAYSGESFRVHVDSLQPGSGSRFALLPPENASGNWVKVVQRLPVKLLFDPLPADSYHLAPGTSVTVTLTDR